MFKHHFTILAEMIYAMEINTNKYRIYNWKHWMIVHWMLNPGLAVNELVLGQRIPKIMLEDKSSPLPRHERSYVPCPHCETFHDGRTWSTQNGTGFKNWFGLYCPACSNIIPCLTNFTSVIILTVTFPLWVWFRKSLKERWLAKQPERFKNIDLTKIPDPFSKKSWVYSGLSFGAFMFLFMEIIMPLITDDFKWLKFAIGVPVWLAAGLGWGYFMKVFSGKRGKQQTQTKA